MTQKIIVKLYYTILMILVVISSAFVLSTNVAVAETTYIESGTDLMRCLQDGQKTIYVDDISFDTHKEIQLNYAVSFVGKDDKSTIDNVSFKIIGPNVAGESISISFKNIIFDGKVDKSTITFEEGKSFDDIVGTMTQYSCIDGCTGYYELNIDNCEIKNYLSEDGSAIYINNNVNYREGTRVLNLTNSKIHHNIANIGTVKVFSDILTTNIDNCDFFANTARAGLGIHVGNGKSTITNTKVHDNDFFRFAHWLESRYPAIYNQDKLTYKGRTTNFLGGSCGAIYIGGSHTTIDNCQVYNNQAIYGGGIGITNAGTLGEDEKVEIKNTEIYNNSAVCCGGGIYLQSNQGETTYFTNCKIVGNSAMEDGSIIYITNYDPTDANSYAGNVKFTFCTMAGNVASDTGAFAFHQLISDELAGTISLKGCFVIDNSTYTSSESDYNYIATKETAISDNVITESDYANVLQGISPKQGSIGDISVPASVYTTWLEMYANAKGNRSIGYIVYSESSVFPYWMILAGIGLVAVILIAIYLAKKKRTQSKAICSIDYSKYSFEDILDKVERVYGDTLTKKEIVVATHVLYEKSRKDIAKELYVSDETIKTHLSNIFRKVGVSSKVEFKALTDKKLTD